MLETAYVARAMIAHYSAQLCSAPRSGCALCGTSGTHSACLKQLRAAMVECIVHVVALSQLKQLSFDMHSNARCAGHFVPTSLAGYRATVHCSFGKISTNSYASDDSVH